MKLTKYEHAALILEEQGAHLVVDPGVLSSSFEAPKNTIAIVITHQHPDHIDPQKIQAILAANPEVQIFSTQDVADAHPDFTFHVIHPSDIQQIGPFKLEFFGGDHAVIHPGTPVVQNVAVLVNETLYYPGDSFTLPHREVQVLAVPAAAPWLKIQEAMDYISAVKPHHVIPTHDAVLSTAGQSFHDMWLKQACEQASSTYRRVLPGESINI